MRLFSIHPPNVSISSRPSLPTFAAYFIAARLSTSARTGSTPNREHQLIHPTSDTASATPLLFPGSHPPTAPHPQTLPAITSRRQPLPSSQAEPTDHDLTKINQPITISLSSTNRSSPHHAQSTITSFLPFPLLFCFFVLILQLSTVPAWSLLATNSYTLDNGYSLKTTPLASL